MKIAEACNVEIALDQRILPHFEVPEGHTASTFLQERCTAGLAALYAEPDAAARERLEYELGVIGEMGFLLVPPDRGGLCKLGQRAGDTYHRAGFGCGQSRMLYRRHYRH